MKRLPAPGSRLPAACASRTSRLVVAAACALSLACAKYDAAAAEKAPEPMLQSEALLPAADAAPAPMEEKAIAAPKKAARRAKGGGLGGIGTRGAGGGIALNAIMAEGEDEDGKDKAAPESPAPANAAPTRAWFPETFLFAPRVVTDASGKAQVDVLVPDRLTTWRVLALAHSRKGAQAGTVSTFTSNLPLSIDVVTPGFLMAGDRVRLPIQITNSTSEALARDLTTKVEGGAMSGAPSSVRVDANASTSIMASITPSAPGELAVEARIGDDDAIRKTIPVLSPGKPARVEKGGTLAAKRSFKVDLEPAMLAGSARASLVVLPGALSILRAELAAAPSRASLDDDAYLLALTGRAGALSTTLGAPIDAKTLDRLSRLAAQRVARRAVNPDLSSAAKLAPGALTHPAGTLVARNGEHLSSFVARSQRPDGTFVAGDGLPLQQVIVKTAEGLAAVRAASSTEAGRQRARAATLRARGAFERFASQFEDPYTSAIVAASGALDAELSSRLKERVIKAIVQRDDGSRALPVPPGVVRADGTLPTEIECTALAILALHDHAPASALLPDLGATVLSAYRPGSGFGDGATNGVALDAVALLFTDPLPSKVVVSLAVDGRSLGKDTLEGKRLTEVMTLDAPLSALPAAPGLAAGRALDVVVESDPPLPGLTYVFAIDYAVAWPAPPPDAGLKLDVALGGPLAVGRSTDVTLRAVAPGGSAIKVVQSLPAGVDVVRSSLEALQSSGAITSFETPEGAVVLHAPARRQGELLNVRFKIVPSLAGTLHARASSAELEGIPGNPASVVYFPAKPWTISP